MLVEIATLFAQWQAVAGVVAAAVICYGGYMYITSAGSPDKMASGKRLIYTALIGLVVVIGAGVMSGVVTSWVVSPTPQVANEGFGQPDRQEIKCEGNLVQASVCELVQQLVQSGIELVDKSLEGVLAGTVLVSSNPGIVAIWQHMLGVALGLLVIILAMYGFGIMGSELFDLAEFSFGQLVKRLVLAVGCASMSLYLLDIPIRIANAVTGEVLGKNGQGLLASFFKSSNFGIISGSLFVDVLELVAVVLGVVLLVFYAVRHMVIVLVAAISPILFVLAIIPRCSKFLFGIWRMYLGLVGVVVVHAVMIRLALVLLTMSNLPVFLNGFAALALMYVMVKTPAISMGMFSSDGGMAVAKQGAVGLADIAQKTRSQIQTYLSQRQAGTTAGEVVKRTVRRRRRSK